MIPLQPLFRRTLSTERNDIGKIFFKENVQKILKDITRYDEKKIFARRPVKYLKTPKIMFMSNEQLEKAKMEAYEQVQGRLQMPPVLEPDNSPPAVISRDEEIVGYTKFKIMFIDIGPGYTRKNRLMSVREPDGTLRFPTHEERSRLNHMFFPDPSASIDPPKLFEAEHLSKLLESKKYLYVLNRACVQFEPDDPRYVDATRRVYDHIDHKSDFDYLRSTRHFGPMSLYLAYNKRADNLLLEMLSKDLVEDAVKLIQVYYTCHGIDYRDDENSPIDVLKEYADSHSAKKYNLDLAIQKLEQKPAE